MSDIAGSSRLWTRYPERMSDALANHDALAAATVTDAGGEVFKHTGDGFLAAFADVDSAMGAMAAYLGIDRFVESLDPAAVEKRAERAAAYLRAARPALT